MGNPCAPPSEPANLPACGLRHPEAFAAILTADPRMLELFGSAEAVAAGDRPVLITGETGTGKELLARAVHSASGRRGRYVALNVAGLDDAMFADTLFGHERGAFTDAGAVRKGMIAQAAGGTLLLDEIGDLSLTSQVKLLRVLEELTYFPLGADTPVAATARFLFATNRDLRTMAETGAFRLDLFHRIQGHSLHVPPLRERLGDLSLLIEHFTARAARELGRPKTSIPRGTTALLKTCPFSGNLRELESMLFDAVSRCRGRALSLDGLRGDVARRHREAQEQIRDADNPFAHLPELPTARAAQAMLLAEALRRAGGNQSAAAQMLGLTQSGVSKALKRARGRERRA